MKKIWMSMISIALIVCLTCSCSASSLLSEDDFVFLNQQQPEDVRLKLNQYFVLRQDAAYFYNMETEEDITISVPFTTQRGIGYDTPFVDFVEKYSIPSGGGAFAITLYPDENDDQAEYQTKKIAYTGQSLDDISDSYESICAVSFCIGYYWEDGGWKQMNAEQLISLSNHSLDEQASDRIVVIAVDIASGGNLSQLCFYYATPDLMVNYF